MMAFQYIEVNGNMQDCQNEGTDYTCLSTMDGFDAKGESHYLAIEDDWFATYKCDDDLLGFTHTDYVMINHR